MLRGMKQFREKCRECLYDHSGDRLEYKVNTKKKRLYTKCMAIALLSHSRTPFHEDKFATFSNFEIIIM